MYLSERQKLIRKYIPIEEYEALVSAQKNKTFIGTCVSCWDINKRIQELKDLENNLGFCFLGELDWLLNYKETQKYPIYSDWVINYLKDNMLIKASIKDYDEEGRYFPKYVYELIIDTKDRKLNFDGLKQTTYYYPDKLVLNIACIGKEVSTAHLNCAYEIIHDFEYILKQLDRFDYQDHITSIDIVSIEEPRLWSIFQSGDGCEFDMRLLNRSIF